MHFRNNSGNKGSAHAAVAGLVCVALAAASGCRTSDNCVPGAVVEINMEYKLPGAGKKPDGNDDNTGLATSREAALVFLDDSRKLLYNDVAVWMNRPAARRNGRWTLHPYDSTNVIQPLLAPADFLRDRQVKTVVLDPGHGGDDPGATGSRRVPEKLIVLDIARRVQRRIAERAPGLQTALTRSTDTFIALPDRSRRASESRADLFVSIHINSAHNTDASGLETYVLPAPGMESTSGAMPAGHIRWPGNAHDQASTVLSYCIHTAMLKHTKAADRGIRRAWFDVLRSASCPAVLVECGFLSNAAEEEKLMQSPYRDAVASGISEGILEYMRLIQKPR